MTTNYPSALDTTAELGNAHTDSTPTEDEHAEQHNNLADAVLAIEAELGVLPKGGFANVGARIENAVAKSPSTQQTVQPSGDHSAIALRASPGQTERLLEIRSNADAVLGSMGRDGIVDAAGYRRAGTDLASTHLADAADILRNPSPAITSPTISNAIMTGTPTAPTQAAGDDSTKIATTAYVISQGYAKAASPAFTGTPTAPTPAPGDNSTKIATTEFVVGEILAAPAVPPPSGMMLAYAGASAPSGWLMCDGSAVSRTTYSALFAVVGTAYGAGDGSTTFNLPDTRGRFVVGLGTHADVDSRSDNDGESTVSTRRPQHAHGFSLSGGSGGGHTHDSSSDSAGSHSHTFSGSSGTTGITETPGSNVAFQGTQGSNSAGSHTHSGSTSSSGGGTHTVTGTIGVNQSGMTYNTVNYIIKT
jgi:microcystin-dependent protein